MIPLELRINVSLNQPAMGGRIQLEENLELPATDFQGIAAIMAQFHNLIAEIKKQQSERIRRP